MKILIAWIGTQDLKAPEASAEEMGPIANALRERSFDRVVLIANQDAARVDRYIEWLTSETGSDIVLKRVELDDPTDVQLIYKRSLEILENVAAELDAVPEFTFHLSPGTWAMATAWAIISKTKYPAELIQSSKDFGVKTVELPFDLSAELLPAALKPADQRLTQLSSGLAVETFGDLVFRSPAMARLAGKATKAAFRSVPILIEGEVGTEKEVIARAIHSAGPRKDKPFVSLNCRAVYAAELEAKIFGDIASEPTGGRAGALLEAKGGTLFLDEVEALPISVQVHLERLLDEMSSSAASTKNGKGELDVRIIAASRTNLFDEVAVGSFREELFYSLAVLVIKIPPLRERAGDLSMIIDALLERINEQSAGEPGYIRKMLAPAARSFLLQRPWPGNVRELENTLRRAAVWSEGEQLTEQDVLDAAFSSPMPAAGKDSILGRSLDEGVDLQEIIAEVARHYISRAIEHAEGNKTTAAKLVGLPSYQTLSNWMKKYEVV